jgi:hypothetical protein
MTYMNRPSDAASDGVAAPPKRSKKNNTKRSSGTLTLATGEGGN